MARDANLVEEAMQAFDDRRDLLRQVGGVHCEIRAASSVGGRSLDHKMRDAPVECEMAIRPCFLLRQLERNDTDDTSVCGGVNVSVE